MPSLQSLTVARNSVTVTFNDSDTAIGYNAEVITTAWLEKLEGFQERAKTMNEDDGRTEFAGYVRELLTDWSVTEDEEGKIPAPLTVENIKKTALEFQGALVRACVNHYTAKNQAGMTPGASRKPSRRTRSRTAR